VCIRVLILELLESFVARIVTSLNHKYILNQLATESVVMPLTISIY